MGGQAHLCAYRWRSVAVLIAIIEMPIVQSGRRGINALELLLLASFFVLLSGRCYLQAATLSDPAVDAYNVRIGTDAGSGAVLSWLGSAVGFLLYTATNLMSPIVWALATKQPVLTSNQWQISLSVGGETAFFCLESL